MDTYKLFPRTLLFEAPRCCINSGSEYSSPTKVGPTSCNIKSTQAADWCQAEVGGQPGPSRYVPALKAGVRNLRNRAHLPSGRASSHLHPPGNQLPHARHYPRLLQNHVKKSRAHIHLNTSHCDQQGTTSRSVI